jgi:hypothetical protein
VRFPAADASSADQGVRPTMIRTPVPADVGARIGGDAAACGACFTDDCEYVSFDGRRANGREQ